MLFLDNNNLVMDIFLVSFHTIKLFINYHDLACDNILCIPESLAQSVVFVPSASVIVTRCPQ